MNTNVFQRLLRAVCLLAILCLLPMAAMAEKKVYMAGETEPFPKDAKLLTLRVAPGYGGDCMLLTFNGESMFIDMGIPEFLPRIRQLMKTAKIGNHVNYFFNSHPHADHIAGFIAALDDGIKIDTMYTFFPHDYDDDSNSVRQKKAMQRAKKYGVKVVDLKTENVIRLGGLKMKVYRVPDKRINKGLRCNDLSGMLMVQYGSCRMLLTGDVERHAQNILARLYDLKVDILKVPHHGYDAMHYNFLAATNPEFAFITNDSCNTKRAQEQLFRYHRKPFMIATKGTITIQTDGNKWIVRQGKY